MKSRFYYVWLLFICDKAHDYDDGIDAYRGYIRMIQLLYARGTLTRSDTYCYQGHILTILWHIRPVQNA